MSTLARRDFRLAAIAALQTIPGLRVSSPGAWDATPAKFPEAKVRTPADHKRSTGRHAPSFATTVALQVQLHVIAATDVAAQDAIEALCGTVERVLIGNMPLVGASQQFAQIVTQTRIDTDGAEPVGAAVMTFDIETFESFDPVALETVVTAPLTTVLSTLDLPGEADQLLLVSNTNP